MLRGTLVPNFEINSNCDCCVQALTRNGIVLGTYPLRVLPSKTAIVPVNNQYLPRTEEERELCGRTVYAANIDKKVDRTDVQAFFETLCGMVLFTSCLTTRTIAACLLDLCSISSRRRLRCRSAFTLSHTSQY